MVLLVSAIATLGSMQVPLWSPVQMDFEGPEAHELGDVPNPFLDVRLTLHLTSPSGLSFEIPGFFDGDGEGAPSGSTWRARWLPSETGEWAYEARFRAGAGVALSLDPNAGLPTGTAVEGAVTVGGPDPEARGFYRHGMLRYVGGHYLRFDDRSYFLKGGTNSPENLLGYEGFDNTFDQAGGTATTGLPNGLHRYPSHVLDWTDGDPYFVSADSGYDARGLIGALNYLSRAGVNSVYFLPMNMGGDGRDTVPFVGHENTTFDKTHYDLSKLAQWHVTFLHAQELDIFLHIVLGEIEAGNQQWLDDGQLGPERKLYYRELVARFAYLPALQWNLSEESTFPPERLRDFADWIQALDPYDHPITFHTTVLPKNGAFPGYDAMLGDPRFSAASLQSETQDIGAHVELWRARSAAAGRKWVVGADEIAPIAMGLDPQNAELLRKRVLYDVYFSGGNLEWFCGVERLPVGGDLTLEDFRTREKMWNYTRFARRLVETFPFSEMEPMDALVSGESGFEGGAEVFVAPDRVYAVYLPDATPTGTIDLSSTSVSLRKRWYDPRKGAFVGVAVLLQGGAVVPLGEPPYAPAEDWVCVFERSG
jgi:hypothetical protein